MEEKMIIESFEHVMPASTDKTAAESWINTAVKPAMKMAGYKMIRWCWGYAADGSLILFSFGEHENEESLSQVWQRKEMLEARDQFYVLFPEAKVSRRIMSVIEG
jgi:hypothetical protein